MNKQELEQTIKDRDSKYEPPEIRANRIFELIQLSEEPVTDWDIICFCNMYLGFASAEHTYLSELVRQLNALILGAHYNMPEDQLALDKKMKLFGTMEIPDASNTVQDIPRKPPDLVKSIREAIEARAKSNKDSNKSE